MGPHSTVQGDVQTLLDQNVQRRGFPRVTPQIQEVCTSPFLVPTRSWEIVGAVLDSFFSLRSITVVYLTNPSSAMVGN